METRSLVEDIILVVSLLVMTVAIGVTIYFGLKGLNLLCRLGYHRPSLSEMSYSFVTREISVHCKVCQKVAYKVKSENQLTDEEWIFFKQIFE